MLRTVPARLVLAAGLLLPMAMPVVGQALRDVPEFSARVIDQSGALDAGTRRLLATRLEELERETGSQVVVLLVDSTRPEAIEQYSIRVADAWRLGRERADDGVLVLIAVDDRDMRIEVGHGLEGALPDARVNRIIDELILPHFAAGDYAAGLTAGVAAIAAGVRGEALPAPEWRDRGGVDIGGLLPILLVLGLTVGGVLKRAFGALPGAALSGGIVGAIVWFIVGTVASAVVAAFVAFLVILFTPAGPGAWSSGRGYGGGFGGGFGGGGRGGGLSGGGGSFGGGGASGRW